MKALKDLKKVSVNYHISSSDGPPGFKCLLENEILNGHSRYHMSVAHTFDLCKVSTQTNCRTFPAAVNT